jgi:RNA polymerase sigma factor (sigma-70 family)
MNQQANHHDPRANALYRSFLEEKDDAAANLLLEELLTGHALPIVKRKIGARLRGQSSAAGGDRIADAEDLHHETIGKLLRDLRKHREAPPETPIRDFSSYVAAVAAHTFSDLVRRRSPRRHSLKGKLQYVLDRHPDLAAWRDASSEWVCGFAAWSADGTRMARNDALESLLDDPFSLIDALPGVRDIKALRLENLMVAVFDFVGGPVEVDDMVNIVATLHGIHEGVESLDAEDDDERSPYEKLPAQGIDADEQYIQRFTLQLVWKEIRELPVQQRRALLLNLRDERGGCMTSELTRAGVASIAQIAGVLQISLDEFWSLWAELPLEDARIAEMFGFTREQVSNHRKAARARLGRRMK